MEPLPLHRTHRIFQAYVDNLSESIDATGLQDSMAEATHAYDFSCFAYIRLPDQNGKSPKLISTYPRTWTAHYLEKHFERFDPVIARAQRDTSPFEWGLNLGSANLSRSQRELFEDAMQFGIACGYTVPIHDGRGPIAAFTFASNQQCGATFCRHIEAHREVLQLIAIYFHAHVRRTLAPNRDINGATLSPREYECLEWAARGKSAWEIGCILGITRRTAAFHLENAKAKLGVHSISHAVARLIASRSTIP